MSGNGKLVESKIGPDIFKVDVGLLPAAYSDDRRYGDPSGGFPAGEPRVFVFPIIGFVPRTLDRTPL